MKKPLSVPLRVFNYKRDVMKRILTFLILFFTINFFIGDHIVYAGAFHSALYGFSIEIPDDWSKRKPTKSWTLFTYAKMGSGENLNMNVLSAKGLYSIKQVPLEQTFYPYYDYVIIIQKTYENASVTDFLKCIYKWKESDLKKKREGKYRLQYYVVQWIRDEKLFTLSITDSENNFPNNIQTFRKIVDSIEFDK